MIFSRQPPRRAGCKSPLAAAVAAVLLGAAASTPAADEPVFNNEPRQVEDGNMLNDLPVINNFFGGGNREYFGELGDPSVVGRTLEDFYTAALEFNPQLDIARERWNAGTARRQATSGQLLPQVSARASLSENERDPLNGPIDDYSGERYSIQLSQVLFDWQAFAARGQAALQENQAEAEYYAALAQVLTDVSTRYFDVLQAQDALRSVQAELDAVRNQLDSVERMYELQLARVTDLYEAQARLEGVRAEIVQRESELALRREALSSITGISVGELFVLEEDTEIPSLEAPLDDWITRARQDNHQIIARQYAAAAADKNVSRQRGAYLPQVNLTLQQLRANTGFDNARQPEYETTYVGVEFNIPLFAGGSSRARISEAVSERAIARSELRQMQLETIERTRTAYLQAISGERRANAARRLVESTETAYTAMQRGFELGTVTSVDVLNALRDRFQAQRDLQQARYEFLKARLELQREAGTLEPEDLITVGSWLERP